MSTGRFIFITNSANEHHILSKVRELRQFITFFATLLRYSQSIVDTDTKVKEKIIILNMELKEPAIAYSSKKVSIEEYLELENASLEKQEYYKGEVFAMGGAKVSHVIISDNILTVLKTKIKKPIMPSIRKRHAYSYRSKYTLHLS